MHHVAVTHEYKVSADKVWETINDFRNVYTYHPFVKHSEGINNLPTGLGAERTCHFEDGNKIKERITEYEHGKYYRVEIFDPGSFPLSTAVGQLEVHPGSDQLSTVHFNMDFQPKYGPIGWLMAQMIMKKQFTNTLKKVLEGLDTHLQTGKIVGKNGILI
jgi:hypothetical protein